MTEIDLQILPLHRQAARNLADLPGLHIAEPPRRAARSRRADRLILLLSFEVSAFSDDRLTDLLTRLEDLYFQKSGSTTSAMRELVEDLNSLILNLNLKYAGERPQITGTVGVIVVRGDLLFLAQSGPGHLFALLPGKVEYLHDDHLQMRSLGSSRTPTIYYAQMQFAPGDKFIFSTSLPDGWDADTFTAAYQLPFQQSQQRFLSDSGETLKGILIAARPGSGGITVLQAASVNRPPAQTNPPSIPAVKPHRNPQSAAPPVKQESNASPPAQTQSGRPKPEAAPQTALAAEQPVPKPPRSSRQARRAAADLAPALHSALTRIQDFGRTALGGVKKVLQRLVPGDEMLKIPTNTMAIIAVAVPLLVVTVAALVYSQIGRNQQYNLYFEQAEAMAQIAAAEATVDAQRMAWQTTIELADKALSYLVTDPAEDLRHQAVASLDALDQVFRLNLTQAISGSLAGSIKIHKMAATSRELFMLDIESDSIFRAWLAGSRYEMDSDFRCGAGQFASIIVQDLIDLAVLPENPDNALLVAMDSSGNLMYCFEDKPPVVIPLTPPDSYWGNPIAITVENERLYVLDEQLNMVWFYDTEDKTYQFREAPSFYFTNEVPDMQNTIDFAVDNEQLYLLYLNGQTATCTYTGLKEAPAVCISPDMYKDNRPGRTPGVTVDGARFYQLQHTQPPEPSLYYLDPIDRSVYHFSLKLNLVQQYRPAEDLPEGYVTAFAISPTKTIFLAMENQVYLAHLP